jgi:MinD superfamily P-loop ATPase
MLIAVASGKGGTGKTTVATNLAYLLASEGRDVTYVDCDVEEPNGHLFLKPRIEDSRDYSILVPEVDAAKCNACGRCAQICEFSAIALVNQRVLTFPKMCHACGGCMWVCPEGAIREVQRPIGVLESGAVNGVRFCHGRLNVGEAMSPPLIRAVRAAAQGGIVILDAPPGTSCPAIAAMRGADYVLLAAEATPFGLHDLGLAIETVQALGLPHGVVMNRCLNQTLETGRDFCRERGAPIIAEIPNNRRIAEAYSRGDLEAASMDALRAELGTAWESITAACNASVEI